jgi:hypothetical protein
MAARVLVPLLLVTVPFARLTPEATTAFDRYIEQAEARMNSDPVVDSKLRDGKTHIEAVDAAREIHAPGAMIQDWVGSMFMPGATLAQVRSVLQDYANYKNYYRPKVIESRELVHQGDEYDVLLRLYEKHILTIVLNSTYRIRYESPDPKRLIVTSRSTHIGEVKDPGKSYTEEVALGDDSGFLWRLNSYWRFVAADGGVYARCEAISLSRDVPPGLGWMLKGFLESFPKESMMNTLLGTRAAVLKLPAQVGRDQVRGQDAGQHALVRQRLAERLNQGDHPAPNQQRVVFFVVDGRASADFRGDLFER